MEGIFPVWKPSGPTSFDIIRKIKKHAGEHRVGHAGTLDPLAEGVLVIGVGREATRQLKIAVASEKEYEATIILGATSTTDDAEGEKTQQNVKSIPPREDIEHTLVKLTGTIMQKPPIYSALKIKGKPAYAYARKGKEIKLEERPVLVKEIALLDYHWPEVKIKVITGPGVYIRALARDLGELLNTGGYLSHLTRTRVGEFTKADCRELETI